MDAKSYALVSKLELEVYSKYVEYKGVPRCLDPLLSSQELFMSLVTRSLKRTFGISSNGWA